MLSALGFLLSLQPATAEANCGKAMGEIELTRFSSPESFGSCLSEGDFNDHFQVFKAAARYLFNSHSGSGESFRLRVSSQQGFRERQDHREGTACISAFSTRVFSYHYGNVSWRNR